jgi:hypothetical protein
VSSLQKATSATSIIHGDLNSRLGYIQTAIQELAAPPQELIKKAYDIKGSLNALSLQLNGDATRSRREFETVPSINSRVGLLEDGMWNTTCAPTQTFEENYKIASRQLGPVIEGLKTVVQSIEAIERELEMKGAPYTPGRWPVWKGE